MMDEHRLGGKREGGRLNKRVYTSLNPCGTRFPNGFPHGVLFQDGANLRLLEGCRCSLGGCWFRV
jgi:hypothetical protein